MFSRNDFPDFMTEAGYIRERHGPVPLRTDEDKELAARAVWMTAFQTSLETCRKMGLGPEPTLVGMINTMTTVVRMLFADMRKED